MSDIFIFYLFYFLGGRGGGWGKIRIMDPLQVTGSKAALNTSLHSKWMLVTEYQRRNSDPRLIGVLMISTAFICQSVCLHVSCQCSLKPVHSFLLFSMQLVRNSFFLENPCSNFWEKYPKWPQTEEFLCFFQKCYYCFLFGINQNKSCYGILISRTYAICGNIFVVMDHCAIFHAVKYPGTEKFQTFISEECDRACPDIPKHGKISRGGSK